MGKLLQLLQLRVMSLFRGFRTGAKEESISKMKIWASTERILLKRPLGGCVKLSNGLSLPPKATKSLSVLNTEGYIRPCSPLHTK